MSELFEHLVRSRPSDLEAHLRQGTPPDLGSLAGYEFRGVNTGALPRRLGLQKFIKGFFHSSDHVEGYNIKVEQDGLENPWSPLPDPLAPDRFGFYMATPVSEHNGRDNRYLQAALLDYGASPRNPRWRVERLLRDYLVVPDPEQPVVLLGKAYLALGPARAPAGFFVIERLRPTDWTP